MLATTVRYDYAVNQACFAQHAVNRVGSNSLVHGDAVSLNVPLFRDSVFCFTFAFLSGSYCLNGLVGHDIDGH